MNMHTPVSQAACPIAIGTPCDGPSGTGLGYVVAVEPETSNISTIGGGGMERDEWRVSIAFARHVSTVSENVAAPMIERAAHRPPCANLDEWHATALAAMEQAKNEREERSRIASEAQERAREEFNRRKPEWAKAAIIAELKQDDCDTMTDYYGSKTLRRVVIGWSAHTRDLFPELRKAAARFPETADLADAPADAEHREKYSMGGGYYLKASWRHHDGWQVSKDSYYSFYGGLEFADCLDDLDAPAAKALPVSVDAGRWSIEPHIHTKKGFDMWICILAERVERAEYDALLARAKSLGGWYSRAWGNAPAGFAFKIEAKALEFVGANTGGDSPSPAPDSQPHKAQTPAPAMGDKLRAIADAMQPAIDDCYRDRLANTPKRARQAASKRIDGMQLERAQKAARALAACHDAGEVPADLARVTTKATICDLAREHIDRSNAGYYDAGLPTGQPLETQDASRNRQALALWALLGDEKDAGKASEFSVQQKIDKLKFAKIEGYFPTPAALIERMLGHISPYFEGATALEPSAGSGDIADALRALGYDVQCVEKHSGLCDILRDKGHKVDHGDFMELQNCHLPAGQSQFDLVAMNPPFERGQDVAHVMHAYGFVRQGGWLVAIMGAGVSFRADRQKFRDWLEQHGGYMEHIEAGAFKESGTGVASVLVVIRKPPID